MDDVFTQLVLTHLRKLPNRLELQVLGQLGQWEVSFGCSLGHLDILRL
jgi:hypothetical protein